MREQRIPKSRPGYWMSYWVPLFAFLILAPEFRPALAQQGNNPFGNMDNGNIPPPPPPPPTDFSDFQNEEDDLGGPGGNLGGFPPPNPPPPPPDSGAARNEPNNAIPQRPNGGAPSFPPRTVTPTTPVHPTTPSSTASKTPQATAPKLADYLELDSSVKGLEVKNFDLPDKDIKDVVTLISKWTGKNFILDSKVRGKITIIGPSQVTLQEAYQAFLSALEANNLTTVQSGKFIRIIESAEARRAPVKTYAGSFAPKDDQFITRIFQLKYINADEVQREFRDLTTRQGKLFAYEPTNSIIITDTGSNIHRIKEILETLDVKGFESTLHVLRIKHGSAKGIAEMLGEIYGDEKGGARGGPRTFRRNMLERTRGGGIISKIIPDEATNSLVVLANAAGFDSLKKLVEKLDVRSTDTGRIHVYYCEYAKAEDLASTLASLSGGGGGAKSSSGSRRTSVSGPNVNPLGGIGGSPTGLGGGPSGPVTAELGEGVKVTSDAATNALVITANSADYQTLKRVIKKLDIPRLQVYVESAILEVTIDNSNTVGSTIAVGVPNRGFGGGFVPNPDQVTQFFTKTGIPSGTTIPIFAGPSFNASTTIGNQTQSFNVSAFMALLNFITTNSNTQVLSTPQIIALDNEKAEFKVQDEIPVVSGVTPTLGGASVPGLGSFPSASIDRKKVGIDIKLTPHVNAASRNIRLEIEQTVEDINQKAPPGLTNFQVGTTSRVTNTVVVVRDKDYIMLGGLMTDSTQDQVSKVPLLGDIPILGWLFKQKKTTVSKKNLVILLSPKIIGHTLDSASLVEDKLKKRDEFIENNLSGDDQFGKDVGKIKDKVKEQESRGQGIRAYDYRNNDEEEDKIPPGQQSEINGKGEKSGDNSKNAPDNLSNLPPPQSPNDNPPLLGQPGSIEPPPVMPPSQPQDNSGGG